MPVGFYALLGMVGIKPQRLELFEHLPIDRYLIVPHDHPRRVFVALVLRPPPVLPDLVDRVALLRVHLKDLREEVLK